MIYYIGEQRLFDSSIYTLSSISECIQYFKNKLEIGIDTETTGYDPHKEKIISLQLGNNKDQFVINCNIFSPELLSEILNDSSKVFLFQNAKFDLKFLRNHNLFPNNIYDTFLAELILNTGYDRQQMHLALDDLAWKYYNIKLDKTIRGNINKEGLSDRVIKYGADDTKWLGEIKKKQLEEIKKWKLESILDLENEVTKVFAKMEYDGISLNSSKWLEVSKITNSEMHKLEIELDNIVLNDSNLRKFVPIANQGNLFGFTERQLNINWGSSQQKKDILRSLGIIEDSTGDRVLQRNKSKHKLISTLIAYNKQKKLNDAFGESFLKFINPITNRIHMDIWPILTTGRISVSNPNLNQIPNPEKSELGRLIRSCFIPKEGWKIVGGDYSGMELRIIAEFSQDPVWIDAFNNNKDLHSELASLTFDIDIKDVKKTFEANPAAGSYRQIQKIVSFGLSYGMSAFKLSDTAQVSLEEAQKIIDKFFKAVPKVKEFLHNLGDIGKSRGYIRTGPIFSRIRWFPEWHTCQDKSNENRFKLLGEIERASMNTPIQGCNGNIIKLALINVQKEIDKNNWPVNILLSVYDEIQTECRSDKAEEWRSILENIMIESAKVVIKSIPVKVDCGIHECWEK